MSSQETQSAASAEYRKAKESLEEMLWKENWRLIRVKYGPNSHTIYEFDCAPDDDGDDRYIRLGRQVVAYGPTDSKSWPERHGRGWLSALNSDVRDAIDWLNAKHPYPNQ